MENRVASDGLAARIQKLEDRSAILDVLYTYAHAIDYGDELVWVDCFTPDATWTADNKVTHSQIARIGRDELLDYASHHTRAPELYHKHIITAPLIVVNGDEASSRCYMLMLVADRDGVPKVVTFGRYRDQLVRCPDGRWRIRLREAEPEAWNEIWTELRGDPGWTAAEQK